MCLGPGIITQLLCFSVIKSLLLFNILLLPSHLSRPATCYLGDGNFHFCSLFPFASLCPPSFPLTLNTHIHTLGKGSPCLSSPPLTRSRSLSVSPSLPPALPLSLFPLLSPSAESHSSSLDQTLQRSRQRKVLPGAQLYLSAVFH